jgi:hypothetical protein
MVVSLTFPPVKLAGEPIAGAAQPVIGRSGLPRPTQLGPAEGGAESFSAEFLSFDPAPVSPAFGRGVG